MIVTFGEIMIRLSPPGYLRLQQTKTFDMTFGGSEANVAVSLSNFGCNTRFVTKLPDNDLGKACIGELCRFGVDTSVITMGGDRIGLYYCEKGASQRASKIIYDRAHSSIAEAENIDFDWDTILNNASWFHFSGITPAISDNAAKITLNALKVAKKKGIIVSCDLNYRNKLWSLDKAQAVMTELVPNVDILIANEEHCAKVLNIHAPDCEITNDEISRDGYISIAKQLYDKFKFKKVVLTIRESISALQNNFSALLYNGSDAIFSKKYNIQIIDRIGGGDSFGAGLIYGLTNGYSDGDALEFAVAACCLKHTIEGDFNIVTTDEVKALADGDGTGRVQR